VTRLVGDGIEHPANARALLDAAAMFGIPCLFRDSRGLAEAWSVALAGHPLPTVDTVGPAVAVENAPGAESVFTAALPAGDPSVVVGNERLGVRPDVLRNAQKCVDIPMAGRGGVNTLNVASAAAVAMYYLLGKHDRRAPRAARPERHRPSLLLLGPGDHVEAGSALRSAAAFGWRTVGVDDRDKVWFGTPRPLRTEARAAARSHRNPLRVVPMSAPADVRRVIVAGTRMRGRPLHRVDLTGGPGTLLVIPDEAVTGWQGRTDESARVDLPRGEFPYRYRLVASIVLAEVARQLGTRTKAPARGRTGDYRSELQLAPSGGVDLVRLDELFEY
jgi:tRNA G18 (ribose-2'-O)-methylase SpoU